MRRTFITVAAIAALAVAAANCGVVDQGRAPVNVRIDTLEASSGGGTLTFSGYLHSDVIRIVHNATTNTDTPTRFNDSGRVSMSIVVKDPGAPGITVGPSDQNSVQITHYRVAYRRTDGRNVQGVDVPYTFDSGMTVSVPPTGTGQQTFDLVRVSAKAEAPLLALASNGDSIDAIADVTFYGKDLHGNSIAVTGSIGVTFANYGD